MTRNMVREQSQSEWRADHEIGILLAEGERCNFEPDVTVIGAEIELGQRRAERFHPVAEVLSSANRPEQRTDRAKPQVVAATLGYGKLHLHCRRLPIAHQDRIEAELHTREENVWCGREPAELGDGIAPPGIGDIGTHGELHAHTPLAPSARFA